MVVPRNSLSKTRRTAFLWIEPSRLNELSLSWPQDSKQKKTKRTDEELGFPLNFHSPLFFSDNGRCHHARAQIATK